MKIASLAFTAVLVMAQPSVAQDTLPEGPGKEPLLRICSQCHEASKSTSIELTRAGWIETIDKMKALGADGSDQEFQAILEYLVTHFRGELDRPVDMNSAEALDMESVLGLLRRESAALLQYRSKRGPFTSLADLKDPDPVILKKIEARKERIVFLEVESRK
jgi:competence protein ComEA